MVVVIFYSSPICSSIINISQDLGTTGLGPGAPHGIVRTGALRTCGASEMPRLPARKQASPDLEARLHLEVPLLPNQIQRPPALPGSLLLPGWVRTSRSRPTPCGSCPSLRCGPWTLQTSASSLVQDCPPKASKRPVVGALSLPRHLKTRAIRGWKWGATQTTSCLAAASIQSCQYCGTKEGSAQASGRDATAGKEPNRALARGTTAQAHASSAHTQPTADSRSVPRALRLPTLYP